MSDNSNEPLDYECCDEHEVSYMGACGMCLTEEINEMIADPKAISLVDKDFLKAVLSFIPAPATSSDELKCKQCGEFVFNDWLSCEDGEFCNHACAEKWKWGSGRYKPPATSSDDDLAATCRDMVRTGTGVMKDGKRIDPKEFFATSSSNERYSFEERVYVEGYEVIRDGELWISVPCEEDAELICKALNASDDKGEASELAKDDLLKNIESALEHGNESHCFVSTSLLVQLQNLIVDQKYTITRLENERDELVDTLSELHNLMEDTISGEYKPDSFTCQPARIILAKYQSVKGSDSNGTM